MRRGNSQIWTQVPDEEKPVLEQGGVTQTLSLLCIHASIIRGRDPTERNWNLSLGAIKNRPQN